MAEFKYEITQELGVISEGKYNIELNMVSWNDREPKYDIRSWAPDHSRMGKGISRPPTTNWPAGSRGGIHQTTRPAFNKNY